MDDGQQAGKPHRRAEFLRVAEVAEMFHVSTKTVVRWASEGKLPHVLTLGGHRRFPRADMERLVSQLQREVR